LEVYYEYSKPIVKGFKYNNTNMKHHFILPSCEFDAMITAVSRYTKRRRTKNRSKSIKSKRPIAAKFEKGAKAGPCPGHHHFALKDYTSFVPI